MTCFKYFCRCKRHHENHNFQHPFVISKINVSTHVSKIFSIKITRSSFHIKELKVHLRGVSNSCSSCQMTFGNLLILNTFIASSIFLMNFSISCIWPDVRKKISTNIAEIVLFLHEILLELTISNFLVIRSVLVKIWSQKWFGIHFVKWCWLHFEILRTT